MQAEMLDSAISNSLQLFQNPAFKVRVIMRCSNPWFVAKDVATCIEHSDTSAMCKLCREKDVAIVNGKEYSADLAEYSKGFSDDSSENPKKGGNPNLTVISESGLYRILAKCNLPKCEPFESWVFDEVLPSIRKTGSYSVNQAQPQPQPVLPTTYLEALEALVASEKAKLALQAERDEAIRTKCHFVEGRDAKVCGELGGLRTQNEALRKQIGDSKTYKAATAIPWLPDYFDMSNRGLYGSLAAKLKKLEAEMPPAFAHTDIQDSRWGSVKAYHVAVIERLHEMVQADENLMKKYRKVASV